MSSLIDVNTGDNYTAVYPDYSYNYTDMPLSESIPVALVYSLTMTLGVIGNFLVIFSTLHNNRMLNVTNTFLVSLASADLLLIVICVPVKLAKWFSFTWNFGAVLCKLVHYLQSVSVICSVLTLTAMSVERYYAILYPMRSKYRCTVRRSVRVCVFVWLASVILAAPRLIGQCLYPVGGGRYYWCIKAWSRPVYSQCYEIYMLLLVLVIPLAIMTYAYVSICRELWAMTSSTTSLEMRAPRNKVNNMTASQRRQLMAETKNRSFNRSGYDTSTRKQVIKMLVAVIVLFVICWAPTLIDNVLASFEVYEMLNYGLLKPIRKVVVIMSYANSCINPIVYAFMSRNFRRSFRETLCSCACAQQRGWSGQPTGSTYKSLWTLKPRNGAQSNGATHILSRTQNRAGSGPCNSDSCAYKGLMSKQTTDDFSYLTTSPATKKDRISEHSDETLYML